MKTAKKTTIILSALLAGLLLSGCDEDAVTDPQLVFSQRVPPPVHVIPDTRFDRFPSDRYRLMAMHVEEDELVLLVRFIGGCIPPRFALLAGADFGVFSGPAPLPAVTLKLSLDARGDRCEERVFQELRFDLTPVRQHFQRTFGVESGTMVLRLSMGRVLYSF